MKWCPTSCQKISGIWLIKSVDLARALARISPKVTDASTIVIERGFATMPVVLSVRPKITCAARELGYISEEIYRQARDQASEVQRLLNGYIDYLKREQPGKNEPGNDINVDRSHLDLGDLSRR